MRLCDFCLKSDWRTRGDSPEPAAMRFIHAFSTLLLGLGLLSAPSWPETPAAAPLPMTYLPGSDDGLIQGHLFSVPVTIGDYQTHFILDTGIGINLISSKLADKLGCPNTGVVFRGQRMSGQTVSVPLSWLPGLAVGTSRQQFVTCGVFDFKGFLPATPAFSKIEGFLSLRFFQHVAFTVDYEHLQIVIETDSSLKQRLERGTQVALELDDDQGVSLTAFALLQLPGSRTAKVEVDTGSDSLILHKRFMAALGVSPDQKDVKTVRGKDETDHSFVRYFANVNAGKISLGGFERTPGRVMFQDIIHDGLIGDEFLKHYTVTYDLAHSRMILGKR